MVTKGIIKSIDLTGNTCTVHMPYFETAGNDPIIGTAIISNTPGSYNGYKVGDIVLVAFEDGGMDTPVVMGKLYLGTEAERADPRGVLNVETSTVSKSASMPADTKLANSMDDNVPNTTAPYSSLSSIANELNTLNVDVGQMDRDIGNRFKQVISDIDGTKSELHQTAHEIRQEVADETSNIRSEIKQTAEKMVAKVSGYETDTDGNPILDKPTEFGWNLQADSWSVFNQDKPILTADSEGLEVTGTIKAADGDIGKFIIGKVHNRIDDQGNEVKDENGKPISESGLYTEDYIDCFNQTPGEDTLLDGKTVSGKTGVYIGTDGIKLGKNFSVDPEGNMTASSLKISYTDSDGNDAIAADNIDDAVAQILSISKEYSNQAETRANGYAEEKANGAKDAVYTELDIKDTNITVDGVETPVVLADKLWVNSANINGQLTADKINTTGLQADKIEVVKGTGKDAQNVLYANAADPDNVKLGNFIVDPNSISLPVTESGTQYKFGKNKTVMICTGSDSNANIGGSGDVKGWNFTAGTNFGVRTNANGESEFYASKGKIGGWSIEKDKLSSSYSSNTNDSDAQVTISPTQILFKNQGGAFSTAQGGLSGKLKTNGYAGVDTTGLGLFGDKINRIFSTSPSSWIGSYPIALPVPACTKNKQQKWSLTNSCTLLVWDEVYLGNTLSYDWTISDIAGVEGNIKSILAAFVQLQGRWPKGELVEGELDAEDYHINALALNGIDMKVKLTASHTHLKCYVFALCAVTSMPEK